MPAAQKIRKILRIADVSRMTGISRTGIYKLARENVFPKPIPLTPTKPGQRAAASGWLESEVNAYIEKQMKVRDSRQSA